MRKRSNFQLSLEDDEESTAKGNENIEDVSDLEESAESKRRRLAKRYVQQLQSLNGISEADDTTITDRLQRERLVRNREYAVDCSAAVSSVDFSSITPRQFNSSGLTCLALSPDDLNVYVGSKDNSFYKWDCETGQKLKIREKWRHGMEESSQASELLSVSVSFDGRYAVSGGRDNLIRVFDCRLSCAEVQTFRGHKGAISGLAFQDNSYSLFSSSFDGTIKNWHLNDMCYYETLFGHQDEIQCIDCSTKDRVLSGGSDRSVRYWKVDQSSHLVFRGHSSAVDAVKFLNDDTYISGGQDGKICVWKDSSKLPVATVANAHSNNSEPSWITALASIKSTNVFASGSYDGMVRFWSINNKTISQLNQIKIDGFVNGLAISNSLMVIGTSKEHRLGRWWSKKSCRDKITFIRCNFDN